ncbi:HAD hydrolase, family IA, variant 3 [Enterobacter sp. J49]|uniref:HAD family hydrolase n=1 Tax=Enterobacter sp. J49 TaxID=1903627 RepID=UPI000B646494|nr:HAD family phosphatase [Enterobacter sp. J49]OUC39428.1 HAD hydrolase, family IA, variant 3 [Enterobacter sp. J49]
MKIRGVIFDMDGVLIDAREWHYQALNQALDFFCLGISREDHEGVYDGLPTRDKLRKLSEGTGLPIGLHGFINELKQHYTEQLIYQHCWPVFEHQYALACLTGNGYRLAVASNSIRKTIETMLRRANLLPYIEFFLSNEDVANGKPDPEIYLKAIHRMEMIPEECVIVEDNPHGITAARVAGAHVMEVKDPSEVTWQGIRDFIEKCEGKIA